MSEMGVLWHVRDGGPVACQRWRSCSMSGMGSTVACHGKRHL